MKKSIVLLLAVSLIAGTVYSQESKTLKNRLDSVSYAVGVSMFSGAQQFKMELNYELVAKALLDASDNVTLMDNESANSYINGVFMQLQNSELDNTKRMGKEFMSKNKEVEGMVTTQTGLQYKIITQGDGQIPTKEDQVKVHYTGYTLDGNKFDSSHDRGEPAVFGLTSIIPGWAEVLTIVPVGTELVVYIPPELAYGDRGAGGGEIPGGSTLMFEIELLDIVAE